YCDAYVCDYEGKIFGDDSDDEEVEGDEMLPVHATTLGDEKREPEESGTSMDSQLVLNHHSGDEQKTNMDIEDGASKENIVTDREKKEKRKTQEDGVGSEQVDGIETAFEVKKKKESISKSDV
ncbi:hypothetical protein MKW94_012813, partial [Papaver nudicaule]|nr:hypothetical protein [Papaver nudicaule]